MEAISTCHQTKFPVPEGEKLVSSSRHQNKDVNESIKHQTCTSSSNDAPLAATSAKDCKPKESKDEWVEQVEVGVYITFITLPNGQKGLKRVRFRSVLIP